MLLVKLCFAQNFEISTQSGILFYWRDDKMSFWDGGINYNNHKNFSNELNFLKISSDLPWFSTDIIRFGYSAKFDFGNISPQISAGFLSQSEIEIPFSHRGSQRLITNYGARGFYLGSKLGLNIRDIRFTPSFLFARGRFEDGDFHYFFGKPDVPYLLHFGLSAEFRERHKIGVSHQNFALNIVNNNEMPLFNSENYVFGINYRHLFLPQRLLKLNGILGANYVNLSASGSLSPANQQYFLFPYMFFNIDGTVNAFVVWTAFSFELQRKILQHHFVVGAANIFSGDFNADAHYLYKRFFGGREGREVLTQNLNNTGFPFVLYYLKSPNLNIRDRVNINFGLRNIIGVPFGIAKYMGDGSSDDRNISDKIGRRDLVKTILLSGLSGFLRVEF